MSRHPLDRAADGDTVTQLQAKRPVSELRRDMKLHREQLESWEREAAGREELEVTDCDFNAWLYWVRILAPLFILAGIGLLYARFA